PEPGHGLGVAPVERRDVLLGTLALPQGRFLLGLRLIRLRRPLPDRQGQSEGQDRDQAEAQAEHAPLPHGDPPPLRPGPVGSGSTWFREQKGRTSSSKRLPSSSASFGTPRLPGSRPPCCWLCQEFCPAARLLPAELLEGAAQRGAGNLDHAIQWPV